MIETILLAFLYAKIRKYKVSLFFKSWTVYPFLAVEFVHLFFQINIFAGNLSYVRYASLLKNVYLFCFILPIIVYREYLQAIVGSIFVFLGTFLNKFVMAQNGGKMPVFPSFSYITGYVKQGALENNSGIHILGSEATRFKILSDIFDVGYSIMSIGDIFIRVLVFLVIYRTIQVMNSANTAPAPNNSVQ